MCIRDRSENRAKALADYIRRYDAIAPEMLHVDWKGEDWEGFVRVLGDFPNPVSYTHLDVYKRQLPHQAQGGEPPAHRGQ